MQNNNIISHVSAFQPWTDERLWQAVQDISNETGFIAGGELQRRFIYERDQAWRVRIEGLLEKKPASLRIECLKLNTDEEDIRRAFRAQASGTRVRPPRTYACQSFDDAKGYAWSLDEFVDAEPLFQPDELSSIATAAFVPFYRELRRSVSQPFWSAPDMDAVAYSKKQFAEWREASQKMYPDTLSKHADLLARLEGAVLNYLSGRQLQFCHAHLSGSDVRLIEDEWVIFANHFWSWRQPGYDLSFTIWSQWMALPPERRTVDGIKEVTESWFTAIRSSLRDIVDERDVRNMLLNRCYGSLILDIPSKHERHTLDEIVTWEQAVVAEAERLLS